LLIMQKTASSSISLVDYNAVWGNPTLRAIPDEFEFFTCIVFRALGGGDHPRR
jgi:hypothetical protein